MLNLQKGLDAQVEIKFLLLQGKRYVITDLAISLCPYHFLNRFPLIAEHSIRKLYSDLYGLGEVRVGLGLV